jgi:hypothetical protein
MKAMNASMSLLLPGLLAVAFVAGCSPAPTAPADVQGSSLGFLKIDDQHVQLRNGNSVAQIAADGALSIDGRAVILTAPQQTLSKNYYTHATAIGTEGLAMGKAGAQLAGKAVSGAIEAAFKGGDPDQVGKDVDAQTAELEKKAQAMCMHVSELHSTQQALAASLPAFQPFARLDATTSSDCQK